MIFTSLILAVGSIGTRHYCKLPAKEIDLPLFPPSLTVTDWNNKNLTNRRSPTGEFSRLKIKVSYASIEKDFLWKPQSLNDAAFALREILPHNYYQRLLDKDHAPRSNKVDLDIIERKGDLAAWIKENWGTSWSKQKESFQVLAEIINYTNAGDTNLSDSCDSRSTQDHR